ncbi:MAG: hypothetical protein Terrestrivirus1_273 [Terrestrivirus sp.]|uniref:Uncharacterized protein n=1 Tax=Terrestrivirus sp. TaxID=2487775 RepID=A0A3G4ZPM9_9VIRU|nr:MAG: hypothetical protein Terrestrivirus1_273 [Terrestrivirus sp.]
MTYYAKYIKYKLKYLNLQHGGSGEKTSYWDGKDGNLFYHPKYGILYEQTHYATDGGPTFHLEDGTQVKEISFIWKPEVITLPNPKPNKDDDDFSKDLRKIGVYSGSQQYIKPDKKSFHELVGKTVDDAVNFMKKNYPYMNAAPIKVGTLRIQNYDTQRVWIDYDANGLVSITPKIG